MASADLAPGRRHAPSVLNPVPLEKGGSLLLPPPPPLEQRAEDADERNLAARLDVMETLGREEEASEEKALAMAQARHRSLKGRRVSVLNPAELESSVPVPLPPPMRERADNTDDLNRALLRDAVAAAVLQDEVEDAGEGEAAKAIFAPPGSSPSSSNNNNNNDTTTNPRKTNALVPLPKHGFYHVLGDPPAEVPTLEGVSAQRLAGIMEQNLFTMSSITRAQLWKPEAGDVVVAAGPRCGQCLVTNIVRILSAHRRLEMEEVVRIKERTAPWIECKLVDQDPNVLIRKQTGSRRVFRTAMAHSMLANKVINFPDTKFIAVLRNPLDLRVVWFEHLQQYFAAFQEKKFPGERTEQEWMDMFARQYRPDEFMLAPITLVQTSFQTRGGMFEYEHNCRAWLSSAQSRRNVLVLLLEEILAHPEKVVERIADFIGEQVSQEKMDAVLNELTGRGLGEISRRQSNVLTREQMELLQLKVRKMGKSDDDPALALLATMESDRGISPNGIMCGVGTRLAEGVQNIQEEAARRRDMHVALGMHDKPLVEPSPFVIKKICEEWEYVLGRPFMDGNAVTYEKLYAHLTNNAKYPAAINMGHGTPRPSSDHRKSMFSGLARKARLSGRLGRNSEESPHASSSQQISEAGGGGMGEEEEEEDAEVTASKKAEFNRVANGAPRRTLVGALSSRLFAATKKKT